MNKSKRKNSTDELGILYEYNEYCLHTKATRILSRHPFSLSHPETQVRAMTSLNSHLHYWFVPESSSAAAVPVCQWRCWSPALCFLQNLFCTWPNGWGRRGGSGEIKERKRKRKRGITNPTQDRPAPKRLLKLEAMPPDTALSASGAGRGRGLARLSGYIAQPLYWLVILGKLLSHSAPQRSHP